MTTQSTLTAEQQMILDLEQKRIQAMIDKDIPTLASLLADDLTYTHSGGRIDTKPAFCTLIASLDSNYEGVDYSGVEVRPVSGGWLVRGRAQIRLFRPPTGERLSYPVWFLDVYGQRDGKWVMVAWQATRIPE